MRWIFQKQNVRARTRLRDHLERGMHPFDGSDLAVRQHNERAAPAALVQVRLDELGEPAIRRMPQRKDPTTTSSRSAAAEAYATILDCSSANRFPNMAPCSRPSTTIDFERSLA